MEKSLKINAGLAGLCAFSILASSSGVAAKAGPREAIEGLLERAGPSNFIAPALLPDVPAPPAVKPVWEGRLENWLKALGDDDYSVRDKATQEMLQEQDPKFEEKLQAILSAQSDPEVAARLRMVIEGLVESRRVREGAPSLKAKLSPGLLAKAPAVAEKALSSDEAELREALGAIAMSFAEDRDVATIAPAILSSLERIEPDPTRLGRETKQALVMFFRGKWPSLKGGEMKASGGYIAGLLKDGSPSCRGEAMFILSQIKPDAETIARAADMLHDPDAVARREAVNALNILDSEKTLPERARALLHDQLPEIFRLLRHDPNEMVRVLCVISLRNLGRQDPRSVSVLAASLEDPSPGVFANAMLALDDRGKLEESLLAVRPQAAARIVGFMAEHGGVEECRKALRALAKHPDPAVARAAGEALQAGQENPVK